MTSSKSKSDEPYSEFLATIKLVSGEEILSKVIIDSDNDQKIIIDNPVVCSEVRSPGAHIPMGYKFEPWMKMSDEECYILNMDKVITLSEIKDEMVLDTYYSIVSSGFKRTHPDLNRKMGYINSVEKSRSIIEKLYNDDDASKEPKKD
tara:strand:+ start:4488 stop:4931 length:444 start_codon:yes stop_codon:yes gene_type:complete